MRRSVPSAGQQWVAPAVHVDRQNWKSPAYGQPTIQYPSSKGKESMNANAGVSEPNASDDSEARRITGKRRFCFDNTWLREDTCRDIVLHSWERTLGLDVLLKIEACSNDIASGENDGSPKLRAMSISPEKEMPHKSNRYMVLAYVTSSSNQFHGLHLFYSNHNGKS
nr:uncharacterized protein LOC109158536 [Ipomoea batatas]